VTSKQIQADIAENMALAHQMASDVKISAKLIFVQATKVNLLDKYRK
jgi:hypothetical protein